MAGCGYVASVGDEEICLSAVAGFVDDADELLFVISHDECWAAAHPAVGTLDNEIRNVFEYGPVRTIG